MTSSLVQTPINAPGAQIILQCAPPDQFNVLMKWLTDQGIAFAQSVEDVKGVGFWCYASDPKNTYFTLSQAIASDSGGFYLNDTAWLSFAVFG